MIRRRWLFWIAGVGAVIAFGPAIVALNLSGTPVLPGAWSRVIDLSFPVGTFLIALAAGLGLYSLWRGYTPKQFSTMFLILTLATYVVCDVCFAIYARVSVRDDSIDHAVKETLYYLAIQPLGTLFMITPFVFLGWIAASVSARRTILAGALFFATGALVLGYMYLSGHLDSELSLLSEKWTASALSVGLLPFECMWALVPLYLVSVLIKPNASATNK